MDSESSLVPQDPSLYVPLLVADLLPCYVVLAALTWILHDYVVTLEDEIEHIWPQRRNFGKLLFLWMRYYSIALLLFDTIQIHVFAGVGFNTSIDLCVAMDTAIRILGAISLWSVEIVMQLRIYALYGRSKRIAAFNLALFLGSIAGFMWILIFTHARRAAVIASDLDLSLPGCPVVHAGIEWAQWVPATAFEGILFAFAVFKAGESTFGALRRDTKLPLHSLLLRDNMAWFIGITCVLLFNNLMVVAVSHIPWFSYGPFHAAVGILTTRMLLNLRKATTLDRELEDIGNGTTSEAQFAFADPEENLTRSDAPLTPRLRD
ncbi:hypothetical protein C8R47DRAFT_1224367 [Mycena vitilis]|nr:hypothetical protein C8R47DRAFT_1224367 [Mycena vitilis]